MSLKSVSALGAISGKFKLNTLTNMNHLSSNKGEGSGNIEAGEGKTNKLISASTE
jgi:hypothetical protein